MILFRFAQAGRNIFQIHGKKSHISPIVWQSQKCIQITPQYYTSVQNAKQINIGIIKTCSTRIYCGQIP